VKKLTITTTWGDTLEFFSSIDFTVDFLIETGWLLFHGEFDSFGSHRSNVVRYQITEMGATVA
jgi:hypothetical protein